MKISFKKEGAYLIESPGAAFLYTICGW